MIATPLSNEPYYPMLLANGRDSVFVDYTGNSLTGVSGHTHSVQHHGLVCGWYKAANRSCDDPDLRCGGLRPLCVPGMQPILFGAAAEPQFYEQRFDPQTATLETVLTFFKMIKIKIVDFLTDDSLFCQTVTVLDCPKELDFSLGFSITEPKTGIENMSFRVPGTFACHAADECRHDFTYTVGPLTGQGFMLANQPYDECKSTVGFYRHIKTGFSVSRIISCTDNSEASNSGEILEERLKTAQGDMATIKKDHDAAWQAYFNTMSVSLPDEKAQYLYDISRYILKAYCHPETGMFSLGISPTLWGGGLYDVCDAYLVHMALLRCGNLAEGRQFIQSYADHAPIGRAVLQKHGVKGTAFAGWDDYLGRYLYGENDFFRYVAQYKPCMTAIAVHDIYWQHRYDPSSLTDELKNTVQEMMDFLLDAVIQTDGESVCLKPVSAGTEAGFLVKVDSFNQICISTALKMAAVLLEKPEYKTLAAGLDKGLSVNYTDDGLLMPFENAPYTGGIQALFYIYTLPNPIDIVSVEIANERGKTPFGTNSEQTTEEYRHWPWNDSFSVICYAHAKRQEKAVPHFKHMDAYCSSLGSLPEKIRMDGYPIHYWYISSHACYVWAINEALGYSDHDDEICLGFGLKDVWNEYGVRDLFLANNCTVSYTVKDGRLKTLCIRNNSQTDREITVNYQDSLKKTVAVPAGKEYLWAE